MLGDELWAQQTRLPTKMDQKNTTDKEIFGVGAMTFLIGLNMPSPRASCWRRHSMRQ